MTQSITTLTEKLLVTKEGAIGWITFNNPDKHNAVSMEMWQSVPMAFEAFNKDPEIRVVILKGAGVKAFVSGADISQFKERRSTPEAVQEYNQTADKAAEAIRNCPKPTIAMVRGFCIGGGTATATNCDMRIVSDDAKFGVPAGKLGLGYRYPGIKRLTDLVGPQFTAEIFFTARQFNAQEALAMGLVNRVVPAEELEKYVRDYAQTIGNNAPLTLAAIKRALIEYSKDDSQRDLSICDKMVSDCFASEDYKEGQTAFMEKRKPVFKGR
jgi:enoyl-CoA hydratase/carnithine racemase